MWICIAFFSAPWGRAVEGGVGGGVSQSVWVARPKQKARGLIKLITKDFSLSDCGCLITIRTRGGGGERKLEEQAKGMIQLSYQQCRWHASGMGLAERGGVNQCG